MAIASSGAVNFDDLRTEFNASGSVSFSDFYRGAATNYVRANAANNTATNLAASVPASGAINFTDFRGAARGFRKTYAANATNQNASSVFGTDWGVDYPKDIVINSGVTLGATSTSEEALEINSGGLGTITITNNGTLIGAGGSGNGGAGGDAFEAAVACTFTNNGYVYAGGGGGGAGGNGGNGSYTSSSSSGPYYNSNYYFWQCGTTFCGNIRFGSYVNQYNGPCCSALGSSCNNTSSWTNGNTTYYKGTGQGSVEDCSLYSVSATTSSTTSTSGGSGGSGGAGAGYNQSAAAGSGGSSGGTNAGSGGSGGTGGGYGASGSSGNSGSNGNVSNGSSGSSGGAAGKYIRGISNVTFTNNGTVAGGTA